MSPCLPAQVANTSLVFPASRSPTLYAFALYLYSLPSCPSCPTPPLPAPLFCVVLFSLWMQNSLGVPLAVGTGQDLLPSLPCVYHFPSFPRLPLLPACYLPATLLVIPHTCPSLGWTCLCSSLPLPLPPSHVPLPIPIVFWDCCIPLLWSSPPFLPTLPFPSSPCLATMLDYLPALAFPYPCLCPNFLACIPFDQPFIPCLALLPWQRRFNLPTHPVLALHSQDCCLPLPSPH